MKQTKNKLNKKAVSVMVGYVLLIVFAIVLGGIVYAVLKTYVPQDKMECPEGTSLIIESYNCNDDSLEFTIRNNGKFDVGGYYIYATDKLGQKKATINLAKYNLNEYSILTPLRIDGIKLGITPENHILDFENEFAVNSEAQIERYDLSTVDKIYAIEIVPLRWQEEEGRIQTVSCADQKIRKSLECL